MNKLNQLSNLSCFVVKPSILAFLIWLLGFILAFIIPSQSCLIFLPDSLLLLGFLPLLVVCKSNWPWFVFALGNLGIGVTLYLSPFLLGTEVSLKAPGAIEHLSKYHVPLVWIGFGFFSFVFGIVRVVIKLIRWLKTRP